MTKRFLYVFTILPLSAFAQSGGELTVNVWWSIARMILLLFLVVSVLTSALQVYNKATTKESSQSNESLLTWLKATAFLIVAFGILSTMENLFSNTMSGIGSAWDWAQRILGFAFAVTFILAIIKTYSKNDDPAAFKAAMNRFGYGVIFLLLSFAVVSGFRAIFESGGKGVVADQVIDDGSLFSWTVGALREAVNGSGIINAFFKGTAGLAVIFLLTRIIKNFSALTIEDKAITIWDYAWPLILVFLIGAWPWLYNGMESGFDLIYDNYDAAIAHNTNTTFMEKFLKDLMSSSAASIVTTPFSTLFMCLVSFIFLFINWIFDMVITLYVEINLIALSILAPIALLFGFFAVPTDSVKGWIMLYMKFKIYQMVVATLNYIGLTFLVILSKKLSTNPVTADAINMVGAANIIDTFAFISFFVMKLLFVFVIYGFLSVFIPSASSSVGSTAGAMAKGFGTVAKLATGTPA